MTAGASTGDIHGGAVLEFRRASKLVGDRKNGSAVGESITAAFGDGLTAGFEREGLACVDLNLAVTFAHAVGLDEACLIHHPAGQGDVAAVGNEIFKIHGLSERVGEFGKKSSSVGTIREKSLRAGGQDDVSPRTRNHPAVFNVGRQQVHAAVLSLDRSGVFDPPFKTGPLKQVVSGQEVGIGQIQGRRDQPTHVDLRIGTEHDAVGVEEDDGPVRLQRSKNLAGILIENAVERNRLDIRLNELGDFVRRNVELLPVDDGLLGGLGDRDVRGAEAGDRGIASDHGRPGRIRQDDWHDARMREIREHHQTGYHPFASHVVAVPVHQNARPTEKWTNVSPCFVIAVSRSANP